MSRTRSSRRHALAALAALAAGGVCAGGGPQLSGSWVRNDELSGDPRAALRQAAESPQGMGGMSRGSAEEPVAPQGWDMLRNSLAWIEDAAEELRITQEAEQVRIVHADGRERALRADGKWHERERPYGPAATKAAWKGASLAVEMNTEDGRKITESWKVDPDDGRLYVTVKLKGPRGKIQYRRVYDAGGPGAGAAPQPDE
jgi:hypothetical protein